MPAFDYSAPADLYPARNRFRKSPLRYMRFDTVAEALRFAMEDLPAEQLNGAIVEVEDDRLDAAAIGALYHAAEFPLTRTVGV